MLYIKLASGSFC